MVVRLNTGGEDSRDVVIAPLTPDCPPVVDVVEYDRLPLFKARECKGRESQKVVIKAT